MFTSKKFDVLQQYLHKYNLQGGIVRNDDHSDELCICRNHYSADLSSDHWQLLSNVFRS